MAFVDRTQFGGIGQPSCSIAKPNRNNQMIEVKQRQIRSGVLVGRFTLKYFFGMLRNVQDLDLGQP